MELLDEGKIRTGAYAIRRNGDVITFYYINGILHYSCSSYGTWRYSEVYGSNGKALIREQYKADLMAVYDKPKLVDGKPVIGEPIWKRGIEWDKVPVDTKILVRDFDDCGWEKRYFAEYKMAKYTHSLMVRHRGTVRPKSNRSKLNLQRRNPYEQNHGSSKTLRG